MSVLVNIITAVSDATRNAPLERACAGMSLAELLAECEALEQFRHGSSNLYERVRALFFLHALHRFHVPAALAGGGMRRTSVPYAGYVHLLARRFEPAIATFLAEHRRNGPGTAISSALAVAYHRLAFQTLADQVKKSVRASSGNEWLFETTQLDAHPLRVVRPLTKGAPLRPVLFEATPVRMDLSHSGWSDIFFLGMDFPEGARVLNVSIDLGIHGRDAEPRPPVEAYFRVIDRPVIRLVSLDLGTSAEVDSIEALFDFARDHLGLLKAAIIASGVVPPAMENAEVPLADVLRRVVGPGLGIELASKVNDIPKGSRLAVSTTLLAAVIAACMRATAQTASLTGELREDERRLVAARAILGEWLAGSGGGWQDSGGIWPGMKRIEGEAAAEGAPEFGVSRGMLLPRHTLIANAGGESGVSSIDQLQRSLVLVHGGMAQNVGPILEMVTEKYLLRSEQEWLARKQAMQIYDEIVQVIQSGQDVARNLGTLTTTNFFGPIVTIIPTATNAYTEALIERVRARFGSDYWGFWMLGGMSGGGMGFIFNPNVRDSARAALAGILRDTKAAFADALPFAMEPVVYDFAVNTFGTRATLLQGKSALMPAAYYPLMMGSARNEGVTPPVSRAEMALLARAVVDLPEYAHLPGAFFQLAWAGEETQTPDAVSGLDGLLAAHGFDPAQHERIRDDLRTGKIGLAQNRLPASTRIAEVREGDVVDLTTPARAEFEQAGLAAIKNGEVGILTLAGGAGSRWTGGAGVTKALHPFVRLGGAHRSFLEIHMAKAARARGRYNASIPHIIATSYLSHNPVAQTVAALSSGGAQDQTMLSPGRAVGLRMVPMARDLRFVHEEVPTQQLDEQKQKMRESIHMALLSWARASGEGRDYRDNAPLQCIHPVGHWYEFANTLRNGVLHDLLQRQPSLRTLMLHNIDTVGVDIWPIAIGAHRASGAALTFEMIERHLEDRGGGLARVDGRLRLVEGLAMPHEEDEFKLRYYSSNTTWVELDPVLATFGLSRDDLSRPARVDEAVRELSERMPTYITLKDVKKRWGNGHEDILPVAQWEKLWGDMTSLPEIASAFMLVERRRGQQLKDIAQLDGWLRDGSAAHVAQLCGWS